MRIGEVHAMLRQDFPDVELSKIRYYEDKGLVRPARSRKGYRLYSERDVACLREAIRLAQEEFVPLRVVRLRLIEQGLLDEGGPSTAVRSVARDSAASAVSAPAPTTAPVMPRALSVVPEVDDADDLDETPEYLRTGEFTERLDLDPALVNQMVAIGLLRPTNRHGETVFARRDLQLAQAAGAVLAAGADPRVLGSLRRNIEREVGVLEEILAGGAEPRDTARVRQISTEVAALRALMRERAVEDLLER